MAARGRPARQRNKPLKYNDYVALPSSSSEKNQMQTHKSQLPRTNHLSRVQERMAHIQESPGTVFTSQNLMWSTSRPLINRRSDLTSSEQHHSSTISENPRVENMQPSIVPCSNLLQLQPPGISQDALYQHHPPASPLLADNTDQRSGTIATSIFYSQCGQRSVDVNHQNGYSKMPVHFSNPSSTQTSASTAEDGSTPCISHLETLGQEKASMITSSPSHVVIVDPVLNATPQQIQSPVQLQKSSVVPSTTSPGTTISSVVPSPSSSAAPSPTSSATPLPTSPLQAPIVSPVSQNSCSKQKNSPNVIAQVMNGETEKSASPNQSPQVECVQQQGGMSPVAPVKESDLPSAKAAGRNTQDSQSVNMQKTGPRGDLQLQDDQRQSFDTQQGENDNITNDQRNIEVHQTPITPLVNRSVSPSEPEHVQNTRIAAPLVDSAAQQLQAGKDAIDNPPLVVLPHHVRAAYMRAPPANRTVSLAQTEDIHQEGNNQQQLAPPGHVDRLQIAGPLANPAAQVGQLGHNAYMRASPPNRTVPLAQTEDIHQEGNNQQQFAPPDHVDHLEMAVPLANPAAQVGQLGHNRQLDHPLHYEANLAAGGLQQGNGLPQNHPYNPAAGGRQPGNGLPQNHQHNPAAGRLQLGNGLPPNHQYNLAAAGLQPRNGLPQNQQQNNLQQLPPPHQNIQIAARRANPVVHQPLLENVLQGNPQANFQWVVPPHNVQMEVQGENDLDGDFQQFNRPPHQAGEIPYFANQIFPNANDPRIIPIPQRRQQREPVYGELENAENRLPPQNNHFIDQRRADGGMIMQQQMDHLNTNLNPNFHYIRRQLSALHRRAEHVNRPNCLTFQTEQAVLAFEDAPDGDFDHLVTSLAQICGVDNLAKAANAILRATLDTQNGFALNVTISRRERGQLLLKTSRLMTACHSALRRHTRVFGPLSEDRINKTLTLQLKSIKTCLRHCRRNPRNRNAPENEA